MPYLISREHGTIFAYSDQSIYHLQPSTITSTALLPAILPLPYVFWSSGERVLNQVQSPSGRNMLIFTAHSICIYQSSISRWSYALQIAKVYLNSFRMITLFPLFIE